MISEAIKIKQATTQYEVLDVIRNRWSARSFNGKSLSKEALSTLLEAASWAPSAMNEQPWRFVVSTADEKQKFERLFNYLMPGNAAWAHKSGALVLVLGKVRYEYKDRQNVNVTHDCGMATMNLLLQATSMDIYGHVMEGFDKKLVTEDLKLGDVFIPVTMIALGYLDAPDRLDEPYKTRELSKRTRKGLDEIVLSADSF